MFRLVPIESVFMDQRKPEVAGCEVGAVVLVV